VCMVYSRSLGVFKTNIVKISFGIAVACSDILHARTHKKGPQENRQQHIRPVKRFWTFLWC